MSIGSCYNEIRMYNDTKVRLSSLAEYLKGAIDSFSNVANTISSNYSLDENPTPIVGKCNALTNDMAGTFNSIYNVLIPAIDNAIARKRNQIAMLEAQEAQERERARLRAMAQRRNY